MGTFRSPRHQQKFSFFLRLKALTNDSRQLENKHDSDIYSFLHCKHRLSLHLILFQLASTFKSLEPLILWEPNREIHQFLLDLRLNYVLSDHLRGLNSDFCAIFIIQNSFCDIGKTHQNRKSP